MNLKFKKMHGLGNDFVILDGRSEEITLNEEQVIRICDRHFGVGCDQLVLMKPAQDVLADFRAVFYNDDGSESGACGNATRCLADIGLRESDNDCVNIETRRGILKCTRTHDDLISVNMGCPQLEWDEIPLSKSVDTLCLDIGQDQPDHSLPPACAVGMGNPHCVFLMDNIVENLVEKLGEFYEHHPLYPERTNVEFVEKLEPENSGQERLRLITWERGSGRTLACGSGACAAAVAAMRRGFVGGRSVEMVLDGGSLFIEWRERDNAVFMTGPAAYVFDGVLSDELF